MDPRCTRCELPLSMCEHGLRARITDTADALTATLLISPTGLAHFAGCPHKGDDPDLSRWAELDAPRAWTRLGNRESIPATGGEKVDLIARGRCQDCVAHGPW